MVICITNRALCPNDFLKQLALIAEGKPDAVILREKELDNTEYFHLAEQCMKILEPFSVPLSIHARPEIARAIGASHVHLPFLQLQPQKDLQVSCSVHSVEEARLAEQHGANYLIAGHIFETDCKKDIPPRGTTFLRDVCQSVSIPVYAIGGISSNNAALVRECGATGGCMMSALMRAQHPEQIIQTYRDSWEYQF